MSQFWENTSGVKWNQLYEFYDETVQVCLFRH